MKHVLAAFFALSLPLISTWVARRSIPLRDESDPSTIGHEEAKEIRQVIAGRRTLAGVLAVALLTGAFCRSRFGPLSTPKRTSPAPESLWSVKRLGLTR